MPAYHPRTHTSWRVFLARPVVFVGMLGAVASVAVAIAGAISGSISSYYQDRSAKNNLRYTAIFELIKHKPEEQTELARKFLQAGLIEDRDGKICAAFVGSGCPIK